MTDATDTRAVEEDTGDQPVNRFWQAIARIPGTLTIIALLVAVGFVGQGLWVATASQPWWGDVAFGVPSLEDGRLWTIVTMPFFIETPWVYIPTLIGFVWVAIIEWQRGTRVMLAYFWIGQFVAILGAAAFLAVARLTPWPWAIHLAEQLDVGPSAGILACFAATMTLLPSPWRQRGWVLAFAYAFVCLLFAGRLADLVHAIAIIVVLLWDRSFRLANAGVRSLRQLAFAGIIALGTIQVVTLVVPTDGPFGPTAPFEGPWIDVALDVVFVLIVAWGLLHGRRWAWVVTIVYAVFSILSGAFYFFVATVDLSEVLTLLGVVNVAISQSFLWLLFLVFLIMVRHAFGTRRRHRLTGKDAGPDADTARALIREHGGGTLSWMDTWEGMRYFPTTHGLVAYQRRAGVALALADPLGAREGLARSVDEFVAAAEKHSLIPAFFSAGEATRDAVPEHWRSLIIADDTIVDLGNLEFTGKAWSHVRQALNRGDREGITFELTTWGELTWGTHQQLRAISESWVGDKGLPEMRFTLGTLQEAEDPEVRVALAFSPRGDVEGFLSWLPVFGPGGTKRGWTLDLMRRRQDGGFPAVMEYLIASSARAFAEEGAAILSLSGAPLAHEVGADEGRIASLLGQLSNTLEPVYGFKSLHHFKTKFNPRYEPIYLLYRDEGDLTRIAMGLTRAFLPDATLRQFAAAGVDLLRKD